MSNPVRRRSHATLLMFGLVTLAFVRNEAATSDLVWPAFDTQYREMAAAQTLLDQGYGLDPAYRGESLWYNPFSGWLAALVSVVLHRPLREVVPGLGPVVNALAPLAFFALLASLVDRWSALAATAGFLFITSNAFVFMQAASYSPWFAPENYGQAFLYLSLLLAAHSHRKGHPSWCMVSLGVALGATFLVHTAPALILGGSLVGLCVLRVCAGEPIRRSAGSLALTLAIAFVTSLPLVVYVLGRYHLLVVNPFPSVAPDSFMDLDERSALLAKLATHTPALVALVAFPWWLWLHRRSTGGQVLMAWTFAVLLFLAYGDLRLLAGRAGLALPTVIPTFHFLFHGMVFVSVGFGIAVAAVARRIADWLARTGRRAPSAELLAASLTVMSVIAAWGPYSRRLDVTEFRKDAVILGDTLSDDTFEWIRAHTRPDDVFLSTDEVSLFIVSPAGRKVVCTNRYFSNPYVDWKKRDEDRSRLFELLRAGDIAAYDVLAAHYGVSYVVASDGAAPAFRQLAGIAPRVPPPVTREELDGHRGFQRVYSGSGLSVYRRASQS